MPAPGDMGSAYLVVRSPSYSGTWNLPTISNIETAYYANLSELPTIIMGFRNNFIIDLGTTEKISLTMKRVNPRSYNDNSSNPDNWSNGKWYRELEEIMDFWQNFGRSSTNRRTGGFLFHYTPSDTSLYPVIDKNVFLNGSLSVQYSTEYMVVQMNLTVARMEGGDAGTGNFVTIILHPGVSDVDDYEYTTAAGVASEYPGVPVSWGDINPGYVCTGWASSSGQTQVEFRPGDSVIWQMQDEPYELWAVWTGPKDIYVMASAGTASLRVSSLRDGPNISSMQYYVVGAGGGAGGCGYRGAISAAYNNAGGGGGAGGCETNMIEVSPDCIISITVGAGGNHGGNAGTWVSGNGDSGGSGGASSIVASDGTFNITARGGDGGSGGTHGSTSNPQITRGGQQVYAGGNTQYGTWGGDGKTGPDNPDGYGRGWGPEQALEANQNYTSGHGAGGGGSNLNFHATINGTPYSYQSRGGDAGGFWYAGMGQGSGWTNPTNPIYGGGGASVGGPNISSTDGADGIVILIFY